MATELLTSDERDMLRALLFDRLDYDHRQTVESIDQYRADLAAIHELGDPRCHSHGSCECGADDWSPDSLISVRARHAGLQAPVTDRAPVTAARQHRNLVSPGRFLAWFNAMHEWRTAAGSSLVMDRTNRVPTDYAGAARYAGLVDVDKVGPDTYAVTPRDATPMWETRDVTPYKTAAVKPFKGTPIMRYGRLQPHEYGRPYVPVSMVPYRVYLQSTADPMAYSRTGMRLQREARDFLAEHGERMPLPDTYDMLKHRWSVSPDRAAYRGQVRFKAHAPIEYQHGYRETGEVRIVNGRRMRVISTALERVAVGTDGQWELETRLTQATYCNCGRHHAAATAVDRGASQAVRDAAREISEQCPCQPRGWIGLRGVVFPHTVRSGNRAAVIARAEQGTASKGPNVTPWSMSPRSLPRAAKRVEGAWQAIESTLRASAHGSVISYGNGVTVSIIGTESVYSHEQGMTYPVREYARRVALARVPMPVE